MGGQFEVNVDDYNFKAEVLEAGVPVLVDFWAEWCGPCRMIGPVVSEIAEEYKGRVKVCKLNVEVGSQVSSEYGVLNIPTLIIFKGGKAVERIVGAVPKKDIVSKLEVCL